MSARVFCDRVYELARSSLGDERLEEILNPPPVAEVRARRRVEMVALGGEIG